MALMSLPGVTESVLFLFNICVILHCIVIPEFFLTNPLLIGIWDIVALAIPAILQCLYVICMCHFFYEALLSPAY